MQVVTLSREAFLTWIGGGRVASGHALPRSGIKLGKGEVGLISRDERNGVDSAPILLVRNEEELQDFYAFVSTYVSTYVPFSAFFRVLSLAEFEDPRNSIEMYGSRLKVALVGVIASEAILKTSIGDLAKVPLATCFGSESFAMAKALTDGHLLSRDRVAQRWGFCEGLLRGERWDGRATEFSSFWDIVFDSLGLPSSRRGMIVHNELVQCLRRLLVDPRLSDQLWESVRSLAPEIGDIREDMLGPREGRARAFTNAVRSTDLTQKGVVGDFVVGYLGVLLAGGAFEYVSLLSGLRGIYPTSALWFGFICGMVSDSDVLSTGASLGRHLLRELNDSDELMSPPSCDIAYAELGVLYRSTKAGQAIRSKSNDLVRVEMFPGSICSFSKGSVRVEQESTRQELISREALAEARRLLARLQRALGDDLPPPRGDDLFYSSTNRKKK